uniref:Uncharacterized protein n=1 Tax=Tanacetum cinerariifolium TaxID=118510 RepID=A0A6L2LCI2_TANCI|nr:hypothetical protein [Tanacetum cinerariifolium]
MPKVDSVRTSGVIIKDWFSDDDDTLVDSQEDSQTTVKPSFKKIEFTKARNESVKSDKQADKPKMVTQKYEVDRKDWNVSTVERNGVTTVKTSAGYVWRSKITDLNNVSKDGSGSWISKRVNLIDPQGRLNGGYLRAYVRVIAGTDDEDSDSELLIPTQWSDESKNEKRAKRWREEFKWKRSLFEIDLTFGINGFDLEKGIEVMKDKVIQEHVYEEEVFLNNNIGKQSCDPVEMPSEAMEQGMDDHVPDEIDGSKCDHVPNHVSNLEVLVCKQVANHGGDELVDKGIPLKGKRVYAE